MRYGELRYRVMSDLEQPNVLLGRTRQGDWPDSYDQTGFEHYDDFAVLEGDGQITAYVESAFETFEEEDDTRAGLVAVAILHHYIERYGPVSEAVCRAIADKMLDDLAIRGGSYVSGYRVDTVDSTNLAMALESHPVVAESIHDAMRERAKTIASLGDNIHRDDILSAYVYAITCDGTEKDRLKAYIDLLGEN